MSIFTKLGSFGKGRPAVAAPEEQACRHAILVPMWDNAADMGHSDKVTRYKCDHCHQFFTAEEGHALMEARVR